MAKSNKIRIKLKAYDHKILDASSLRIIEAAKATGAKVVGPIPLPTEKQVYTILRAVHKYKDSREQFEMRTHKRLIDIVDPNPTTVDTLTRLNLVQDVYEGYLATQHDFLPGGKELLVALKESGKYRIFMATNGIPAVQNPRIKDSGVGEYFDKIFISEHMGFAKPDKRFFDRCFAEIEDFNPEETIMVGDSLSSDIQGGINAGIKTCHFNPRNYPYKSIIPDYKITSLDQLIPLIEGIE